jgi:alpha-amylase/alpha-mannosidase (GH57 family)
MAEPLYVTFLWHMHQPYYKDPGKEEYFLPWTYLHGVKDYFDMAAIVDETEGARVVFNLVPSLLEQLLDYASGAAVDPFLVRGEMAPADMGEEDRLFVLGNFFSANRQRMIEPNRRYLELFHLADGGKDSQNFERLRSFRDQDILDLQVWFFLSWTGEAARRRFPELMELVRKGKNFTQADKALLFARQREIIEGIIPLYKKLHEEGKAELAVSPYFHPILPLLCDSNSARDALPRITLPGVRFMHPEDARAQVAWGMAYFEKLFGFTPAGMWPSEGSVSDEALAIISDCGLKWVASDEDVLLKSLIGGLGSHGEALYQPYSFPANGSDLLMFFRDHGLSDLIGFTYSQWEPVRAINDFLSRIKDIRANVPESRVVSVILDGENAWEYYPNNGYDFLKRLYTGISGCPGLELATFSDVISRVPVRQTLQHVHPGSWINSDYGIWIGHPEENLAWELLERSREATVRNCPQVAPLLAGKCDPDGKSGTFRKMCKSIYAAEGSDWFWWYGDDHFSPYSDRFDLLFRKHLMNLYRLLKLDIPLELIEPIKKESPAGLVREPADLISPVINGYVTSYFEWLAAGLYDLTKQHSAMHAAESAMHSFYYGFDHNELYFRIDGSDSMDKIILPDCTINLHLILDREYMLSMGVGADEGSLLLKEDNAWKSTGHKCFWKIARVCEARVPLKAVNPELGGKFFAYINLLREDVELGRWPAESAMVLKYAGPELGLETWLI